MSVQLATRGGKYSPAGHAGSAGHSQPRVCLRKSVLQLVGQVQIDCRGRTFPERPVFRACHGPAARPGAQRSQSQHGGFCVAGLAGNVSRAAAQGNLVRKMLAQGPPRPVRTLSLPRQIAPRKLALQLRELASCDVGEALLMEQLTKLLGLTGMQGTAVSSRRRLGGQNQHGQAISGSCRHRILACLSCGQRAGMAGARQWSPQRQP